MEPDGDEMFDLLFRSSKTLKITKLFSEFLKCLIVRFNGICSTSFIFFISEKPRKSGEERKPRKNANTEASVYRKGMNKKDNDWKELVKFFC